MDFDRITDRRGTGSLKWNAPSAPGKSDVIPLWVADMDFPAPEAATAALKARLEHPVLGYTAADPEYVEALRSWYGDRYGAALDAAAFSLGPGLVPSLGIAVRTFSEPGDGVLLMTPVYYPFYDIVRNNGRTVVEAPLNASDPFRMRMDLEAASRAAAEAEARGTKVRMLLFCSPHNPGGVVWTGGELAALVDFARERGLVIACDEIHGDLVFEPSRFVSLAAFPGAAERTVVLSAPNKTFNLAGLHLSHFVAEDERLRAALKRGIAAGGFGLPDVLAQAAARAAYERGALWLDELLRYLRGNAVFAADFVNANVAGVRTAVPEGTYLLWADAAGLIAAKGLSGDKALAERLTEDARVRFNAGSVFGSGGSGFIRMNAACPRSLLAEGLERLASWAAGK